MIGRYRASSSNCGASSHPAYSSNSALATSNTSYSIQIPAACFNSITGTSPQYLSDLLQRYTPIRQLRSASHTRTFVTPRVNTTSCGERSFCYAVWNSLSQTLSQSYSSCSFKSILKNHLFNTFFKLYFFTAVFIIPSESVCVCVCACACVRACVGAWVRALLVLS